MRVRVCRHNLRTHTDVLSSAQIPGLTDCDGFIQGLNEYLEQIMETGVDEMSWDDLSKNDMEWPPVLDVQQYRREVYKCVKKSKTLSCT